MSELTDLGAAVNVWSAFAQAAQVHGAKRLLVADAVSKAGDWMLFVAVSAILYQGGGAAALAIYSVARLVVPVAAGPWSGRVGAGLPPRLVMIASDLARAALLVVAAAAATWSAPVWLVLVPVVGCTLLAAWFNPAEKRFQRDAVPADQRPAFYAVIGATGSTAMIFAPAVGGLLLALWSAVGVIIVDAVSFVVSAALIASIRTAVLPAAADRPATSGGALSTAWAVVRHDGYVLVAVLAQFVACTVAGASLVVVAPLATRIGMPGSGIGWLTSGIGVGTLVGVVLGGPIARRRRLVAGVLSIVAMGVALGVFGMSREIVLALLASVALGVLANLPEPLYWSTYAERVDEGSSGPFYGLVESLIISAFAVGGALSGALLSWFGVSTAAWVLGLAAAAATGALLPTARRWQNRQAPRSGQVATEDRATT